MSVDLRPKLEEAIGKFNKKAAEDPKLAQELEGIKRVVLIDCNDGPKFHFTLENKRMTPLADGPVDNAEVKIVSDSETLMKLLTGELKPMKAWALKKVKIDASLEDLMRLRKFF